MRSTTNEFIDRTIKTTDQTFYNDMGQIHSRRLSVESDDILNIGDVDATALNWMMLDIAEGLKIVTLRREFSAESGVIITYIARRRW